MLFPARLLSANSSRRRRHSLGVSLIVRNEAATLPRLARSLADRVDHWTVVDTGSTDDTITVARRWLHPLTLIRQPWAGFAAARNAALHGADHSDGWWLTIDADETFEGDLPDLDTDVDVIDAETRSGSLRWWKPRLFRAGRGYRWHGRCHEYLDVGDARRTTSAAFHVRHHGDGGGPVDKHQRNLELLHQDWAERPDARTAFYLARTYDDHGERDNALDWYRRRLDMGDWEEELFYSRYRLGVLVRPDDAAVAPLWQAWALRPHRVEPLVALAEHYRLTGCWRLAWLACATALDHRASAGPGDLFVDVDAARWRLSYETSIAAWWVDHRDIGRRHLDSLLDLADLPEPYRTNIQANARYYEPDETEDIKL